MHPKPYNMQDHINTVKEQMAPANTLDIHNEKDLASFKAAYEASVERGNYYFRFNDVLVSHMLFDLLYDSYNRSLQQNSTNNN